MTEIAAIFHWSPDVMEAMSIEELTFWGNQAVGWFNRVHGKKE